MRRARDWLTGGLCLCAVLFASGCATHSQRFAAVEEQVVAGKLDAALQALEKDRSGNSRDEVLYLLNRAMLLRMQGQYAQSNEALEQAKRLIDELDAISVSEQAASLSINDTLQTYLGDDYERALLHAFAALNYLQQGRPDEARVEALQLDVALKLRADAAGDGYVEDAFSRYLSGLVFEQLGEWSDAMIAYRKAYRNYRAEQRDQGPPVPHSLKLALLRLAEHLGLRDELRTYRAEFGIERWPSLASLRDKGEVVVVIGTGLAPVKRSHSFGIFAPEVGVMVTIATPVYETRPQWVDTVQLTLGDIRLQAELVEDIDVSAQRALDAAMPAITARALARAVVKYQAARQVQEQNEGLGLLVNIAGLLTEQADTRSWSMLPQRLYLARRFLAPGRHDIALKIVASDGRVLGQKRFSGVEVQAGRKIFLSWAWVSRASAPPRRRH